MALSLHDERIFNLKFHLFIVIAYTASFRDTWNDKSTNFISSLSLLYKLILSDYFYQLIALTLNINREQNVTGVNSFGYRQIIAFPHNIHATGSTTRVA